MDFKGIRRLYLPLRPKGRFSPGRKTPPRVSLRRPAAATRPTLFKVGDNQRPERTMSGAAKIFAGFPLHDNLSTGTEDSASLLTTPDMVRSGRVLLTSVKSPYVLVTAPA